MSNIKALYRLREKIQLDVNNPWSDLKGDLLAMCDKVEREVAERFVELPEGWTAEQAGEVLGYWPRWDDGSPCMFGDEFTCWPIYYHKEEYEALSRLVIYAPDHVWNKGEDNEEPHHGGYYEWNFTRPGGENAEEWRPTRRKPRTIEDVLEEFADMPERIDRIAATKRYADEIRKLLGVKE